LPEVLSGQIAVQIEQMQLMMNEECPEMRSELNEIRPQAVQRLFLAVVNQAIFDVLENGKEATEAKRWLLSKDFDALNRVFTRAVDKS
jgi:hypothetical protein